MKRKLLVFISLVLLFTWVGSVFTIQGSAAVIQETGYYGKPTLDGTIGEKEWPAPVRLSAAELTGWKLNWSGAAEVPADLQIDMYLQWDKDGLYIGFEALDSTLYAGGQYLAADGFSVGIDMSPTKDGGSTLKDKNLVDKTTVGDNRAVQYYGYMNSTDSSFHLVRHWVADPCEMAAAGFGDYFKGAYITAGEAKVGFSGEMLIPWWLLANDLNTKAGETLIDQSGYASGTMIAEGFELHLTPVYYDFGADGTPIGQYAAISTDAFNLTPAAAGLTYTLTKSSYDDTVSETTSNSSAAPESTTSTVSTTSNTSVETGSAAAPELPQKGGNYRKAVIDGVVSKNEYPVKYTLTSANMKGWKLDYSGPLTVPNDLKIDLYFSWTEEGLYVGYEAFDSTPYFGPPNTYKSDQFALMIDLGPSAKGGSSLKGKTLKDASSLDGNKAPQYDSFLDNAGNFIWTHLWVPNIATLSQAQGFNNLCAGKILNSSGKSVGFSGEYLIPWWLLAADMNQKTGEALFDLESGAYENGTLVTAGFELNIMPVYYDYDTAGNGLGQYALIKSDEYRLEPDYAGIQLILTDKDGESSPSTGGNPAIIGPILLILFCVFVIMLYRSKHTRRKSICEKH